MAKSMAQFKLNVTQNLPSKARHTENMVRQGGGPVQWSGAQPLVRIPAQPLAHSVCSGARRQTSRDRGFLTHKMGPVAAVALQAHFEGWKR